MTKEEKKECLRFNDQRGTAVTLLSEAGATIPQICSITRHTLQSATLPDGSAAKKAKR